MTDSESRVVFDSWAWLEVLQETTAGSSLDKRYLEAGRVVTPAFAITEISGKSWRAGLPWQACDKVVHVVRTRSRVHPLDDDIAALAAQLSIHLRKRHRDASYADAVMLATARTLGLPLISNDKAFVGCADVRAD